MVLLKRSEKFLTYLKNLSTTELLSRKAVNSEYETRITASNSKRDAKKIMALKKTETSNFEEDCRKIPL